MGKNIFNISILLLVSTLILTGCASKEDNSLKNIVNVTAPEQVEVRTYTTYDDQGLIVYMTNNNSYNIGCFEVKATYYDKDGNKITDDYITSFDFKSKNDYALYLELPLDSNRDYYIPKRIDVNIEIDKEYQESVKNDMLYNDKIVTSHKKIDNEIEITVINNLDKDIENVMLAVLFMKNNKPISIKTINGFLKKNEKEVGKIDIPIVWGKSDDEDALINYDDIKIVVNRASKDIEVNM